MAGARGESQLEVGGRVHNLLYTNRALMEAEQLTGKGIMQLFDEVQHNTLRMGDLTTLLRVGLEHARRDAKEGGKPISHSDATDLMDQVGFQAVLPAVWSGIAAVLAYNQEEEQAANP